MGDKIYHGYKGLQGYSDLLGYQCSIRVIRVKDDDDYYYTDTIIIMFMMLIIVTTFTRTSRISIYYMFHIVYSSAGKLNPDFKSNKARCQIARTSKNKNIPPTLALK